MLLVVGTFANAQISITFLSENDNTPLVFAPVKWKVLKTGKILQSQTNIDGTIKINNDGGTIITTFSFLGYELKQDTFLQSGNYKVFVKTDVKYLPEAVVTDQYTATNAEKAVQKIIVIDEKKIKSMGAVNLGDLLTNQLNFKINNDNQLGSNLSIMGLNGQNIKILIDGIPIIGRMNGNIDISQINLNDIERIEIIEGPLSVAYGTNALGGAINIITKKKLSKKINLTSSFYFENIGKYNADATIKYRRINGVYNFSFGRNYFDGWSAADYLRFDEWKPKEQYFGRFQYLRKIKCFDVDFKTEYFNEKLINKGVPRPPYYETAFDEYFYTNRFDNSVTANSKFRKNRFLNLIFSYNTYSRVKNRYLFNRVTLDRTLVPEANEQDTTRFSLFVMRGTYSKSLMNAKLNYQVGYDINLEKGSGQRLKNEIEQINDFAGFISVEYSPKDNLQIKPGVRYSYNSAFKTIPIPSINFKYSLKKNTTLRTSYARGFRAPDLKELYLNFVDVNHDITGNPNLNPEKSDNFQFSINRKVFRKKNIFSPEFTLYFNTVKDRIFLSYMQNTNYTYMNISKFKSITGTLNFGYKTNKFSGNIGATLSSISTADKGFGNSGTFYEISNNTSFLETKTGITASLFLKFNSKTYNFTTDENSNTVKTIIPQYFWSDFTLNKSFWNKRFFVNCGIKNIFNIKTLAMSGVSNGTHSNGGSYQAGMGRTYFIKVEYNFAK